MRPRSMASRMASVVRELVASLGQFARQEPLSFLLFLLGGGLVVLGVTRGFGVLMVDDGLRVWSICLGVIGVIASVAMHLREPAGSQAHSEDRGIQASMHEQLSPDQLSVTQRLVLRVVEEETVMQASVVMSRIESLLGVPPKELFYRLEQLRLLGFVDHELLASGGEYPENAYRPSAAYARMLGRRERRLSTAIRRRMVRNTAGTGPAVSRRTGRG